MKLFNKKKQLTEEDMALNQVKFTWVKVLGFVSAILTIILLLIILGKIEADKYVQILIGIAILGLFAVGAAFNLIKKTIGFNLGIKLMKLNRLKYKGYGLLKEFTLAGRPQYHIVKYSDIIKYKTKHNGQEKQGMILYHPHAKYEDFGNNIPVIEGSYSDISPKNFFTGNRIGMVPDLTEKIIVETGISQSELDDVKKHRRWMMYFMGGIAIAGIISFDLFAQRLAEANASTIACYEAQGKSATIVAGGFVKAGFEKFKEKIFKL